MNPIQNWFNLDLHLVHQCIDAKVAVVGILYKIGRPDSFLAKMEPYLKAVSSTREVEKSVGTIDPRQIKIGSRKYYRYIGSLTTPPCDQNVIWTIVRTVSREQLRIICEAIHDEANAKARPVQALNNRWLKLYRPNDDETNYGFRPYCCATRGIYCKIFGFRVSKKRACRR
ncbi:putative carbonic anhydrase [Helianthus anomalus]